MKGPWEVSPILALDVSPFKVMSESEEPKPSKNFVKEGTITDGVLMT